MDKHSLYILVLADIQKIRVVLDTTIKQLIQEVERVTERLIETYPCDSCNVQLCYRRCYKMTRWAEKAKEKLAEYEAAEEEGRLVVLPCKVGDTVWTFYDDMSDVVDFTVEKIQIEFDKNGKPYFLIDGMDFEEDCLGKTLFFDREEAEKALKEMNKNE